MFPYSCDPNYKYNKNNRRSWYPQQNSYSENANFYGHQNQPYWNFDHQRLPIYDYSYYNNNNNYSNHGQNNYRGSYPIRHPVELTNTEINNLTISPSINNNVTISPSTNKEADVQERSESDKDFTENGAESTKNSEKDTTIPSEISCKDGNSDEVDMEIDSDVDTIPFSTEDTLTTSPYNSDHRSYFNFLNETQIISTKEVTTEKTSKIESKKIKRKYSTADKELHPISPAKRKEKSASIQSDLDALLKSLGPSSIITRSKSRENLLLQEEMLTFTKKIVTNEKNSEMSAEQPKRLLDKPAKTTIRRRSMLVAKPNAETKPQPVNRDPRLQNRNALKMTIKSIAGQSSMATISSNSTTALKAPTTQKDAHQDHQKKERIKTLFGDEDLPRKHSQTETVSVKTTSKDKDKRKEKHAKKKNDILQKTKSSIKDKSDSTAKRHKSAAINRKSDKNLGEKKAIKNILIHTNVEVEPMEEVVQTNIPEFEVVSKTAQPLIHGVLIPSGRVIETSFQLCDDQVGVIDLENLPGVSESSIEDLLIKTERVVEEFSCEGYPSSDNRDSSVTEDGDIFEYLRETNTNNYEVIAGDKNFDSINEHTSDVPQISTATDETLIHSPPPFHTPMEVQEIKFIPSETADVKPVLPVESIILIDDEDQMEELVKIEHVDFADKFVGDLHYYHLVENTVYELSVNTATSMDSKNNYLELFDSRKQIFERISRTMYSYFRKHEILSFDCKRLVEEINTAYTAKYKGTISNLKILRFLHNVILTWRRPVNYFMKQFSDDIGHYMMLSNMEADHENNQPPKSKISSTSETVVTTDSTPSQTGTVATTTSSTKQMIIISPRPIEQLLAKPSVQQPISDQTQPLVNNLSSPTPQHEPPLFSPSSTESRCSLHQITSPQSTSRTADSLPPTSYQSTHEDHLNIVRIQNPMESLVNRIPPVTPASFQTQSSLITNRKSRAAKKVVNKSQNQFTQLPQILLQPPPPPPYSTNLHRNTMPGQNRSIPYPTYQNRLQPNQNLPDTHNHVAEVPTSQTSLWSLQHMSNTVQPKPQSKQFPNNSSLNACHARYLQSPGVPVQLMQSRSQQLTNNSTHGSQLHEQVQPASSVNSNSYYPSYHGHTENQQRQHEVLSRPATALIENLPIESLYFHGHELENYNTRLQTPQLQHQVAVQPSLLGEQLGRPLRNSPHGYSRQSEVPITQPRDSHSRGTLDSADSCLRSPLNLSSQFAVPHPSATPSANLQRTSQQDHGQQFQRLTGQAQRNIQKSSSQKDRGSSNGNRSSLNQHPISSRVTEITSTSKTPDIENSTPPSGVKSYPTLNNAGLNSEPIITTVVVKTEIVVPNQIDTMECIIIDDDDDDDNNKGHSEGPGLSSPTITSSLNNTQTQDNIIIINLSQVCICNKEAIFICVCKKALYCSVECQEKDWNKHSSICN